MLKSVIFAREILKTNISKIKNIERDHCHYTGKNRGAAYYICNLNIVCLKNSLWFFIMDLTMVIFLFILSKNSLRFQ